jgi:hypothetical protein
MVKIIIKIKHRNLLLKAILNLVLRCLLLPLRQRYIKELLLKMLVGIGITYLFISITTIEE